MTGKYTGSGAAQRDSQRLADMQTIMTALDTYKAKFGQYPNPSNNDPGETSGTPNCGGWDVSAQNANNFIADLVNKGILTKVPVDPVNDITSANGACGDYSYLYYRYPAGSQGADSSKGAYYVLGINKFETISGVS